MSSPGVVHSVPVEPPNAIVQPEVILQPPAYPVLQQEAYPVLQQQAYPLVQQQAYPVDQLHAMLPTSNQVEYYSVQNQTYPMSVQSYSDQIDYQNQAYPMPLQGCSDQEEYNMSVLQPQYVLEKQRYCGPISCVIFIGIALLCWPASVLVCCCPCDEREVVVAPSPM